MSTKYIVNNLPGQTIDGNPIDPKYRVYTALLTQSGGDDPQQVIGDNTTPGGFTPNNINAGVTYTISSNTDGDFIPFGAPNNDVGTSFVTTQNAGYYTATFELDYNTGAPVVTVLENTIGNIWFTYARVGGYTVESSGLFLTDKTAVMISYGSDGNFDQGIQWYITNEDSIGLNTGNLTGNADNMMTFPSTIEIRVYN